MTIKALQLNLEAHVLWSIIISSVKSKSYRDLPCAIPLKIDQALSSTGLSGAWINRSGLIKFKNKPRNVSCENLIQ